MSLETTLAGYFMAGRQPGRPKAVSDEAISALYDPENPQALINMIPPRLVPIMDRIKEKLPRMLLRTERELRNYCEPDERDDRVRLSFWDEYNAATAAGKKMSLQSIICGSCSWEGWVTIYEPNNHKMLWVFTPPTSYVSAMRQILYRGTERLLEIMNLPLMDKEGKIDAKVATLVLKAWQLADMRVKGGIVQRMQVEQKNLNLNLNADSGVEQAKMNIQSLQLEDLEVLERRIERAKRDQVRYLKGITPEQRELIIGGDLLEDLENVTKSSQRYMMPNVPEIPDLPDIELNMEEVADDKEKGYPQ
jgi:hypothetical protein